jgi:hypothetical protein
MSLFANLTLSYHSGYKRIRSIVTTPAIPVWPELSLAWAQNEHKVGSRWPTG